MGHTGAKGHQVRVGAESRGWGSKEEKKSRTVFRVPEIQSGQEVVVP